MEEDEAGAMREAAQQVSSNMKTLILWKNELAVCGAAVPPHCLQRLSSHFHWQPLLQPLCTVGSA